MLSRTDDLALLIGVRCRHMIAAAAASSNTAMANASVSSARLLEGVGRTTRGHFQPLCKAARAPRRRVRR